MSVDVGRLQTDLAEVEKTLSDIEHRAVAVPLEEAGQVGGLLSVLQAKAAALRSKLSEARALEAERQAQAEARQRERDRKAKVKALKVEAANLAQDWQAWQDEYLALSDQVEALWARRDRMQSQSRSLSKEARAMGLDVELGLGALRPEVAARRRRGAAIPWRYRGLK